MHSDFSTLARSAKDMISVPDFPMEALRASARRGTARERVRTLAAGTAICLAALGVGAGFGRTIYDGVSVWWSRGIETVVLRSLAETNYPTLADLRGVLARATFPVVLPVGVPPGTRLGTLLYSPLDRPNMLLLQYHNERAHFDAPVSIYGPGAGNMGTPPLENGRRIFSQAVYRWQIGSETVTVPKAHVSRGAADRIRLAMMKASPRASLITTARMLPRIVVLGIEAPGMIALAERYAPAKGRSVLVGQFEVHRLSTLAKSNKPMLDMRTLRWTRMPQLPDGPDFAHATQRPFKTVVVPVKGVRALRAALLFAGTCRCALLYNQPSAAAYWVWTIPESASAEIVRKYAVNAKTLVVHLLR